MQDLFGNEHPDPAPRDHAGPKVQLDLLTHAAERAALSTGRPLSQERTEITAPQTATVACTCLPPKPAADAPLNRHHVTCALRTPPMPTCAIHGSPLLLEAGAARRYSCPRCA